MTVRFKSPLPVGSTLLSGAQEIGNHIGLSRRQTYYLVRAGRIKPVFKLGGRKMYCCRVALNEWLAEEMSAGRFS